MTFYDKEYAEAFIRWRAAPSMIDLMNEKELREALKQVVEDVERKRKEIAMWKKRANDLECEISTLDLIISRKDKEIAELVKMLERVERNAVMPDTTWQLLDELISKYRIIPAP